MRYLSVLLLVGCGAAKATAPKSDPPPYTPPPPQDATEMIFHGGNVLHSPSVQAVYWGASWSTSLDVMPGTKRFLSALGNSDYLQTASEYADAYGPVTNALYYVGSLAMYSPSYSLIPDGSNIKPFLNALCANLNYVPDQNTIYVVFADTPPGRDSATGKLSACAWHTSFYCYSNSGAPHAATLAYIPSLVSESDCNPNDTTTGHSVALASVANVTAHEIMETITDPWGNGWFDEESSEVCEAGSNCENGDKCSWSFAGLTTLADSSQWKLQMEWSNKAYETKTGKPNQIGQYGCIAGKQ